MKGYKMEHKNTKLIGHTFTRRHPSAEYENETRTLKITGLGDWSGCPIVECEVIAGRGDWAMVYVSELPEELLTKAGLN